MLKGEFYDWRPTGPIHHQGRSARLRFTQNSFVAAITRQGRWRTPEGMNHSLFGDDRVKIFPDHPVIFILQFARGLFVCPYWQFIISRSPTPDKSKIFLAFHSHILEVTRTWTKLLVPHFYEKSPTSSLGHPSQNLGIRPQHPEFREYLPHRVQPVVQRHIIVPRIVIPCCSILTQSFE